nr:hypothetical protein [Tanacetum cinerariifolium]
MSVDNTTPPTQPTKDESQTFAGCATSGVEKTSTLKPPEQILKCPRCDSPNTKFCYYNNYSLTQPRHFCKTCRRYWTKGGALRNVPIGGGCRKKKNTSSSLEIGGLSNLFTGLSPPATDFQLNGLNQFSSPFMNLDSLRLKFLHAGLASFQEFGITNNLASSIESSLSSINQDLHQQQRLASLFSGFGGETEQQRHQIVLDSMQAQKLQPIMFQNLETSQTEWSFFDGNYAQYKICHESGRWIWCRYWTGPMGRSCTKSSEEMNSCTIRGKPLVLPWGRTLRLDSGVSKAFNAFCEKFHIPEEVYHVLPDRGNTMHERPAGNIGLYTSRHYILDKETYPLFLDKDGEDTDIFAFIHTSNPTKVKVTEQRDFTSGGGEQGINIRPVTETTNTVAKDVIPLQPRRLKKRKTVVADNAEVRGEPIPTLPFMTSSVSATLERELEGHTDSVTGLNLRTISASQRPFILVITAATTITSTVDPTVVVKEKLLNPICLLLTLPRLWNVTNGSRLDDGGVCREMVDKFAPPKFFASVRGMEHDQLFTEFNVRAARQMSLSAEVRMRVEYNIREHRRFKSVVGEKDQLLKARDEEIKILKAQMLLKEAEATKAICLRAEASNFDTVEKSLQDEVSALNERNTILEKECNALDVKVTDLEVVVVHELQVFSFGLKEKLYNYENLTKRLEEFQDAQLKVVNDKFDKLYTNFVEMTLHLEERFYSHLLITIARHRWLLTYGMELAIAKCLNSPEYLSALGTAISKAIEKGMQDGLAAGITHGKEGRVLTDVAAYNPSAEVDYVFALQQLQEHLAERLGLNESQPHADQLMVPIHHSPDKTVVGTSALSLALDVYDAWVRRIRENNASHRSFLHGVFVLLAEPFSAAALTGTEGTFDTAPDTTTALSTTFVSASSILPISTDDYEVIRLDGQEGAGAKSQGILMGMLILLPMLMTWT